MKIKSEVDFGKTSWFKIPRKLKKGLKTRWLKNRSMWRSKDLTIKSVTRAYYIRSIHDPKRILVFKGRYINSDKLSRP